jgi:2-polyprenyl-6-methoxyphenol hydroxylase-like FAD-dependent oxidoreductase
MGGSMAGLVAARVLSDHFDEVTVVERDPIPDQLIDPRKGVPQGYHLHVLLTRGERALERMFPGLRDAAIQEGAVLLDWGLDVAWYHFGGWKARMPNSGIDVLCSSRPVLESHVRRRLFALPNVRRLDRHDVLGIQATADRSRLTGVIVRARDNADAPEGGTTLEADLVVDAGGRGSKALGWLEELGYAKPPESSVRVQVGYASRIYAAPEPGRFDWRALYVLGAPPESRRLGAIFPLEGGRVFVVLGGLLGDYAPDDPDGYLEFAKALPGNTLEPAMRAMEPLSDIVTYRFPAHRRRHFERAERLPEGFVVTGDALVSFNPIYAQGMTTSCLYAELLDQCLSEQRRKHGAGAIHGLSRRYHKAAARIAAIPWLLATSEDFRFPEVEGERPPMYPMLRWYTERLHRGTLVDPAIYRGFIRVMHMVDGPETLFDPRMAWRVLRAARAAPM